MSAFKFLHILMQLYNYRDVYASELTNLQVDLVNPITLCGELLSVVVRLSDP